MRHHGFHHGRWFWYFFFICSWLFFIIRRFVWLIFIIFNVAFIAKKPHLPAVPTPIGTVDVGSPITTAIRQLKIKVLITHLDLQFTKCFQYVLKMSIMYSNMHLKYPTYCTFSIRRGKRGGWYESTSPAVPQNSVTKMTRVAHTCTVLWRLQWGYDYVTEEIRKTKQLLWDVNLRKKGKNSSTILMKISS